MSIYAKTYQFLTGNDGFTLTNATWDSVSQSIQAHGEGRNTQVDSIITITDTFANIGVPSGSTITGLQLQIDARLSQSLYTQYAYWDAYLDGVINIDTVNYTPGVTTNWSTHSGNQVNVNKSDIDSFTITIDGYQRNNNAKTAYTTQQWDNVSLIVTYETQSYNYETSVSTSITTQQNIIPIKSSFSSNIDGLIYDSILVEYLKQDQSFDYSSDTSTFVSSEIFVNSYKSVSTDAYEDSLFCDSYILSLKSTDDILQIQSNASHNINSSKSVSVAIYQDIISDIIVEYSSQIIISKNISVETNQLNGIDVYGVKKARSPPTFEVIEPYEQIETIKSMAHNVHDSLNVSTNVYISKQSNIYTDEIISCDTNILYYTEKGLNDKQVSISQNIESTHGISSIKSSSAFIEENVLFDEYNSSIKHLSDSINNICDSETKIYCKKSTNLNIIDRAETFVVVSGGSNPSNNVDLYTEISCNTNIDIEKNALSSFIIDNEIEIYINNIKTYNNNIFQINEIDTIIEIVKNSETLIESIATDDIFVKFKNNSKGLLRAFSIVKHREKLLKIIERHENNPHKHEEADSYIKTYKSKTYIKRGGSWWNI